MGPKRFCHPVVSEVYSQSPYKKNDWQVVLHEKLGSEMLDIYMSKREGEREREREEEEKKKKEWLWVFEYARRDSIE